jgi:hypothetical protein
MDTPDVKSPSYAPTQEVLSRRGTSDPDVVAVVVVEWWPCWSVEETSQHLQLNRDVKLALHLHQTR